MTTMFSGSAQPQDLATPSPRFPLRQVTYLAVKRLLDIGLSLILLVLASPVMLLIAIAIKVTSPGPVLFRQKRLGQRGQNSAGRDFSCYKFRTMIQNAESLLQDSSVLQRQFEESCKIKNDPRVTCIGIFLRKTSLDELPQLFNVLRGEMSLVGPRAKLLVEAAKYGEHADRILSVKPGLSGYWQVYGRSDTSYQERIQMDLYYITKRTTWMDIKIIFITAYVVFKGRGAY